jgi:hypothetical protein
MGICHKSPVAKVFLVVMVIMMLWLIGDAIFHDNYNTQKLKGDVGIWTIPELNSHQQKVIDKAIDNYFHRRFLNKSGYKRMVKSAKEGIFRGAVGGCILNGPTGIVPGAVIYGVMGAVNTGIQRKMRSDDKNIGIIQKF